MRLFLGDIKDKLPETEPACIELEALRNHVFVTGVTASGKTNTCAHLFAQLVALGIPVLVLEPYRREEYRTVFLDANRANGTNLVFSLGDETVAPFRFNPLQILDGVNVLKTSLIR